MVEFLGGRFNMSGRPWTWPEQERLMRLAAQGFSRAEAAQELNRPFHGLRKQAMRAGARFRHMQPDAHRRSLLLGLIERGLGISEISRHLHSQKTVVHRQVLALERDGLVVRTGGASRSARYVVTATYSECRQV